MWQLELLRDEGNRIQAQLPSRGAQLLPIRCVQRRCAAGLPIWAGQVTSRQLLCIEMGEDESIELGEHEMFAM